MCYGPGLRGLDADGLGLLPNTWLDCVFSTCESGDPCLQTLFWFFFVWLEVLCDGSLL